MSNTIRVTAAYWLSNVSVIRLLMTAFALAAAAMARIDAPIGGGTGV